MLERYSRQIRFQPIGEEGQKKLLSSSVLIVGAGALGSWMIDMLARAGVGHLIIVDRDYVEESNLQRQQLYSMVDVESRMPKAIGAKNRVLAVNPSIEVEAHVMHADAKNLEPLVQKADLIIDGTDNFDTRFLLNDLALLHQKPWIFGACVSSYASTFTIIPGLTPCLQCLLRTVPMQTMTCDSAGIISPAVGQVVVHQMTEAMKILTGDFEALRGTYLYVDLWKNEQMSMKVAGAKHKGCVTCGDHPTYPFLQFENQTKSSVLCGRDTVQIRSGQVITVSQEDLVQRLVDLEYEVMRYAHLITGEKNGEKLVVFPDGRMLIHGTKDMEKGKAIYQKVFS